MSALHTHAHRVQHTVVCAPHVQLKHIACKGDSSDSSSVSWPPLINTVLLFKHQQSENRACRRSRSRAITLHAALKMLPPSFGKQTEEGVCLIEVIISGSRGMYIGLLIQLVTPSPLAHCVELCLSLRKTL